MALSAESPGKWPEPVSRVSQRSFFGEARPQSYVMRIIPG